MSSYRFCRTDDIGLLVEALNRCWAPYFPDEPLMTTAAFKRSIRDLQVWCSSCMVAFSGSDPIGVLIGAKRPSGTLVHKIAVHPDHRRQGHGHHLLESLGSKLAILGPPRIVAEVPETLAAARELFGASGYSMEAVLTDYVLENDEHQARGGMSGDHDRGFVIPVSVDDLTANGLLGEDHPQTCWERSVETLTARKDDIAGLGVASDEQIEAYLLYMKHGEIVSLRTLVEDGGARLNQLLSRVRASGISTFRFPKVHPTDFSEDSLEMLGFRRSGTHVLYAGKPGSS
ncbi:MAG TPA: GNAT family N-acetyltransferase [Vicinamibacterales bacterium]|jgi:GNAT superfamily N-acetyltransferase|nr:GNAT family N-acetyltransferase [Vicinamibacterales bacterium]